MKELVMDVVLRLLVLINHKTRKLEKEEDELQLLIRARTHICRMQLELLKMGIEIAVLKELVDDSTCTQDMVAISNHKLEVINRRRIALEKEYEEELLGSLRAQGIDI